MTDARDRLVQWLKDAHAMERQAETMLDSQASRLEHYPELRQRLRQHLDETRSQAGRLEECLVSLGADSSGAKDAMGRLTAMAQGIGGMFAGDEVVKGAMAGYTFEHFEISAYMALVATAEVCGEARIASVCRDILREEEAMAEWLHAHLPEVTRTYLQREQADLQAGR
ncbi:ferritin-like domain-containing protein [Geminicoccaceae bacterium 1502E]|nr:ferritin-like domain-containing protein [Geminicoccaceae bacterium 1502E]